ncbi:adenylate kinase [Pseudonocardia sp. CA-107938]|uniref:adenylate kinase n=1 Tax=Pseudonocardia sp. CA-107938 TaxID=3240021 RepID=UPI003D8E96B5
MTDIVLIGPPGVGKGTQALVLADRAGLTHLASGDLLRASIRDETVLGLLAKTYVDSGRLVPDELVVDMMVDRMLSAGDTLLDGFPRTVAQAEELEERLGRVRRRIDAAVLLTAPRLTLIRRIVGRRSCRACQAQYNTYFAPSRVEGICDACGGELVTRSDDNATTAQLRLEVYDNQTAPLVEHYRAAGVLREIDGTGDPDEVAGRIAASLSVAAAEPKVGPP